MSEMWGRSLRSRSPSPARSADFIRGKGSARTDMSFKGTNIFKKSDKPGASASHLRKSTGSPSGMMTGKSMKESSEMNTIEAEYIRNLQQQIYFLELEANYLCDQANKATEKYPKMTAEAEKMLARLKAMEKQMGEMQMELKRRNMVIEMSLNEKERLAQQIREERDKHVKEQRLWTEEIVQLKKVKDRLEMETVRKDTQLLEAKTEIDKSAVALSNAEVRINSLKKQLQEAVDELQETQAALEERSGCGELERKDLEEKLSMATASLDDKDRDNHQLREELSALRYQVKELELGVHKQQMVQDRAQDERARLAAENEQLRQQASRYSQQLERGVAACSKIWTNLSSTDDRPSHTLSDRRYTDPATLTCGPYDPRQLDGAFRNYKPLDKSSNYQPLDKSRNNRLLDKSMNSRCSDDQLPDSGSTSYSSPDGRLAGQEVTDVQSRESRGEDGQSGDSRSGGRRLSSHRSLDRLPPGGRPLYRSNDPLDIHDIMKKLQIEINHLKEQKKMEQQKAQHYLEEMTQHELAKNTLEMQLGSAKLRVAELESAVTAAETDNAQLRKDKLLLVDHVADLQSKIEERDREIMKIQHSLHSLEVRVQNTDYQTDVQLSLQSQKWEEFGRLAESMRTLSHTMASQAQSRSGKSTTNTQLLQSPI